MLEKTRAVGPVPARTTPTSRPAAGRSRTLVRSGSRGSTQGATGSAGVAPPPAAAPLADAPLVAALPPVAVRAPAEPPPHAASSGTTRQSASSLRIDGPPDQDLAPPAHVVGTLTRCRRADKSLRALGHLARVCIHPAPGPLERGGGTEIGRPRMIVQVSHRRVARCPASG